jgi:hypothetical protein
MEALKSRDFVVPAQIDGDAVRVAGNHYYDQIAVRVKDPRFVVTGGGMIDLFADVFRDDDEDRALYAAHVPNADPEKGRGKARTPEALYAKWRTWQMSDHAPLWIEIATDYTDDFLRRIAEPDPGPVTT